ncbi:HRDC domain-containing protein [Brachybacterium sp. MASK1Z-5]|uniref:HRDC domain-containing protein n=1 Tax=Brachybacterium halotolerans TaxID=2795215 RepID=A0ABS1B580_9MICO|nr:HRDC domain-containing protein [Brachybacterium halotolerans]MBK0329806.1 HRDC domain-containing protein [Brachybacterium halotolerans]
MRTRNRSAARARRTENGACAESTTSAARASTSDATPTGTAGGDEPGADSPAIEPTPLGAPRDGLVPVIDRIQPLLEWCERAASTPEEPIAVDAERASSYRYSAKAYLVQIRTEAAGTALIDPTAFTLPTTFVELMNSREWVLHAATQDLPSLGELGLHPATLFDTELAARLLGMPRVGLGAVVEDTVHLRLAKEHSAADWSKRPLPEPWLVYAALDVEVLVEVRDILSARLEETDKTRWAREEFAHEVAHPLPAARAEPWRKLHGLGALRTPRQLAAARAMWERRDQIAREQDLSPHRVIKDRAIVDAAKVSTASHAAFLAALPKPLHGKETWWQAARAGVNLPDAHLPSRSEPSYPPPHKLWSKKWPEVWERYLPIREAVAERAEQLHVPSENLLTPGLLRQWVWEHEAPGAAEEIRAELTGLGARDWQAEIVAPVLAAAPVASGPSDAPTAQSAE